MMTDNELDNLFKNALGDHEAPIPADIWQRVQPGNTKKRRLVFWWSWAAVAAILLMAGVGIWRYTATSTVSSSKTTTNNIIKKENKPQTIKNNNIQADSNALVQQNEVTNKAIQANTSQTNQRINAAKKTVASSHSSSEKKSNHYNDDLPAAAPDKQYPAATNNGNNAGSNDIAAHQPIYNNNVVIQPQASHNSSAAGKETKLAVANNNAAAQNAAGNTNKNSTAASTKKESKKAKLPWFVEFLVSAAYADKETYDVAKENTLGFAAPIPPPQPKPALWNYNAGVRIGIPLTKKLSLKTGLQFAQTRQKAGYQQQNVLDMVSFNGFADTSFYRQISYKTESHNSTYNAINIPVLVSYKTGKKIQVGATAGVVVNAYSWYTGKIPNNNYTATLDATNTYKHNTGAALYAGITVTRKVGAVELFAEPHLQYSLNSFTKTSIPFKQKINTYGVSIGVRTALHK